MSETPIPPVVMNSQESQDNVNVNHNPELTPGDYFDSVRDGFSNPEDTNRFNLNRDEELNENLWTREELETPVQAIQRIEEARQPASRAQEVEEILHFYGPIEQVQYGYAVGQRVEAMRESVLR